jgi:SAM-dependent methyltransferase
MIRCEGETSNPTDPLSDTQRQYLENMPLGQIPHGASVDIEWPLRVLPYHAKIAEFGSGQPGKSEILSHHFFVTAFDINKEAVRAADEKGIPAYVADITDPKEIGRTIQKEQYDAVVMEGLLCNLMGPIKFQNALNNASRALKPSGHLFIADVLAATSEPNIFFKDVLGDQGSREYWKKWQTRYANNRKAFNLPDYHFVVFSIQEGTEKDAEWGSSETLITHINRKERYARHIPEYDLHVSLELAGFSQRRYQYVLWRSRTGAPLIGFKGDWQKQVHKPLQLQRSSV